VVSSWSSPDAGSAVSIPLLASAGMVNKAALMIAMKAAIEMALQENL